MRRGRSEGSIPAPTSCSWTSWRGGRAFFRKGSAYHPWARTSSGCAPKTSVSDGHSGVRALSLLVVALLVYARDPSLFRSPRFWAEEGTNYFGSAITHGFLDGLSNLQAAPYNPYLHLVPHLATLVA